MAPRAAVGRQPRGGGTFAGRRTGTPDARPASVPPRRAPSTATPTSRRAAVTEHEHQIRPRRFHDRRRARPSSSRPKYVARNASTVTVRSTSAAARPVGAASHRSRRPRSLANANDRGQRSTPTARPPPRRCRTRCPRRRFAIPPSAPPPTRRGAMSMVRRRIRPEARPPPPRLRRRSSPSARPPPRVAARVRTSSSPRVLAERQRVDPHAAASSTSSASATGAGAAGSAAFIADSSRSRSDSTISGFSREERAGVFAPLSDALAVEHEPRARFLDEPVRRPQIDHFAHHVDAGAEHDSNSA